MGFSSGGTAVLHATDPKSSTANDTEIAGVVSYYPLCGEKAEAAVPTLVLIGEKDDWVSVPACQALQVKPNFEVAVYPGATHSFTMQFEKPFEFAGHQLAYDEASTMQAAERTEAFIAAQLK